ncbi:MAG TPA: serine/threonine-protein kinase [Myxococcaceae bacterium]|jgi:hypothetical protein
MIPQFPRDPSEPELGSLLHDWIVADKVGSGTHGVVFRALQADGLDVDVRNYYALKLAREPDDKRFEREMRLLARIHHPGVPRYEGHGYWKSPGGKVYPYLVMQWVEGVPLYAWAAIHGLTLRESMVLVAQAARALEATHEHGLHRDVKGDNVLVTPEGRVKLVDFGSCWYPYAAPLTDPPVPPGTEAYRSPQLLRAKHRYQRKLESYYEFQQADDVYALGVMAYRLVACKYPPKPDDPECKAESGGAWPPHLPMPKGLEEVCPEFSALIRKMLAEEPEARGRAGELAEVLERLVKQERPEWDRRWLERSSFQPTEKVTRPGPPRFYMLRKRAPRFALAASPLALMLLAALLLVRDVEEREVVSEGPLIAAQEEEKPDAGTRGMGETAMAAAAPVEKVPLIARAVTRDLPKEPLKGQKRPPCDRRREFVAINGGCWFPEGGKQPPCETHEYSYQGRCYTPLILPEGVPTSDDSQ